jgi:hypothetical protein
VKNTLENLGYVALAMLVYLLMLLVISLVLGRLELAWAICKGFGLLWVVVATEQVVQGVVQKVFGWSELEHFGVVVFNLLVALGLCLAWSAFVVLEVTRSVQGIGWLGAGLGYGFGLIGTWLGFGVVTSFFTGSLYRMVGLAITGLGFLGFAMFPAVPQNVFGWFFALWQ